jgi:plasmid stability protein
VHGLAGRFRQLNSVVISLRSDIIDITDIPEVVMASLLIRDMDDEVKRRLRVRAAQKGVSMEAEARSILGAAVAEPQPATGAEWIQRFRAHFEDIGFADDLVGSIPDRRSDSQIPTSRRDPFNEDFDGRGARER